MPQHSYTCTCTHVTGSLSFCRGLASLACPGPCCGGLGVLSFPRAVCRLNPVFLHLAFLQQRFGTVTCFVPLSLVPISSPSLPFLSPEVGVGE